MSRLYMYRINTKSAVLSRKFIDFLKSPTFRLGTTGLAVTPGADVQKLPQVANQLSDILVAPVAEKLGNKRLQIICFFGY
ncbi:hypothetical protein CAL7716_077100 [Calothrix sp. PCC 7716]|nr:hypothetical protein CAL7716_077100 [Calothrix sp. PCC 7716]